MPGMITASIMELMCARACVCVPARDRARRRSTRSHTHLWFATNTKCGWPGAGSGLWPWKRTTPDHDTTYAVHQKRMSLCARGAA